VLTAQGHPRATFHRAIERGNLLIAETTARELGKITLVEALELVALIAQKDPFRHGRAGARWVRRYLEEQPAAGLDDVTFVTGCLSALGGPEHGTALTALRAVSESASQRTPVRRR
jgi:hypothetical protein